jgi:LPXTG-site transpeptidase (sortase) family protein
LAHGGKENNDDEQGDIMDTRTVGLEPATQHRNHWWWYLSLSLSICAFGAMLVSQFQPIKAAPILSLTPITWNVVGLDGSDVSTGPNSYLVGARVCNEGDTAATNLTSQFTWDSENEYITLNGPASLNVPSLPAGRCVELYYHVRITRSADALGEARRYHITVSADGVDPVTTPTPREVFVEELQAADVELEVEIEGPGVVVSGQTYIYRVTNTQPEDLGGFEQLTFGLDFPNALFLVESVTSEYTFPPGETVEGIYADACGWDADPTSPNYQTCVGPENIPGGKVGGRVTVEYRVRVLGAGTADLTTLSYGISEGDYGYFPVAADSIFTVTAIEQAVTDTPTPTVTDTGTDTATVSPTVTFTPTITGTLPTPTITGTLLPDPSITNAVSPSAARVGQNLTFTLRVFNNGGQTAENVTARAVYSTFLDIVTGSTTTTKGSVNVNAVTRTVTTTVGTVSPGEIVTITIVTRVNSGVTTTTSLSNVATLTFTLNDQTQTRTSNQVLFQVQPAATLPGTGEPVGESVIPLFANDLLLGFGGFLFLGTGYWASRRSKKDWVRILAFGIGFSGLLLLSGCLAKRANTPAEIDGESLTVSEGTIHPAATLDIGYDPAIELPIPTFATPDELPDYPIPSPTFVPAPGEESREVDTSPPRRIEIPDLGVSTVVKYVPFDGLGWLIEGLKEEVAWLGETSWPGLGGNTVLAGHVTLRGRGDGPFKNLDGLPAGGRIRIYTEQNLYTYQLRERLIVEETDMWVVENSEEGQLTLVTCIDYNAEWERYERRLVVFADLVEVEPYTLATAGRLTSP